MSSSVLSSSSIDTIVFSPTLSPEFRLKTIHLNTHITPIDLRTTTICPSSARSHHLVQSDGTQDSHSPSQSPQPVSPISTPENDTSTEDPLQPQPAVYEHFPDHDHTSHIQPHSHSPVQVQVSPQPSPPKSTPSPSTPSPGSQGHPPRTISSLPATTPSPPSTLIPWSPTVHPSSQPQKLQRANSNPTIGTPPPVILSPQPLRRRVSASPTSPPSKLQTIPIEPLRRQGSGADLSPIDECRASECDGKRKIRLEREAKVELERLQRASLFIERIGDGDGDGEEFEGTTLGRGSSPLERDQQGGDEVEGRGNGDKAKGVELGESRDEEKEKEKPKGGGGAGGGKMHNCLKLARGKSYGRVFHDPFSATVALLVLPFCPPLSVYLTFRECGGLNRHRVRALGVAVLLTVLGWVPGFIYALVVFFRHLPRPNDPQENQALHLSPCQRDGYKDVLSEETVITDDARTRGT